MVVPYSAEPATDFTIEENKKAFKAALEEVKNDLGIKRPLGHRR